MPPAPCAAWPGCAFQPCDQLGEVVGRQGFPGNDQVRIGRNHRHRIQITDRIIRQAIDRGIHDVSAEKAEIDGVAVRRGTNDAADRSTAGRARHVFNDDRLAEALPQPLGQHARDRIGGTARGKSDDHGNLARRIDLRQDRMWHDAGGENDQSDFRNEMQRTHDASLSKTCWRLKMRPGSGPKTSQ